MSYESFKQSRISLSRAQIIGEFTSRSYSVAGIHYYTKLIKERLAAERQGRVDEIKSALTLGGIVKPDVVWGGNPDVIPDPGGDPEKDEVKYFVKVAVEPVIEGPEPEVIVAADVEPERGIFKRAIGRIAGIFGRA